MNASKAPESVCFIGRLKVSDGSRIEKRKRRDSWNSGYLMGGSSSSSRIMAVAEISLPVPESVQTQPQGRHFGDAERYRT